MESGTTNCLILIGVLFLTGFAWLRFARGGIGSKIRRDMLFGPRDERGSGAGGAGGVGGDHSSADEKMLMERANSRREKMNAQLKRELEALEEKDENHSV